MNIIAFHLLSILDILSASEQAFSYRQGADAANAVGLNSVQNS